MESHHAEVGGLLAYYGGAPERHAADYQSHNIKPAQCRQEKHIWHTCRICVVGML